MSCNKNNNRSRLHRLLATAASVLVLVAIQFVHSNRVTSMSEQHRALQTTVSDESRGNTLFTFCQGHPWRCKPLSDFFRRPISFTHISKCGGVSWIKELKRLAGSNVIPQGEAGPEMSLDYQNEIVKRKRKTNNNNNNNNDDQDNPYRLMALRNPRHHLYSQFRHCAYSDFGRGYSKVFPRQNENSMVDFATWLNHYWNETSQEIVLEQSPYRCYHPGNMMTRFMTTYHKNPAVMEVIPQTFDTNDDLQQTSLGYWQYDFVGLLEFYPESKCLLFHRILQQHSNNNNGKDETMEAMQQYLDNTCTCATTTTTVGQEEEDDEVPPNDTSHGSSLLQDIHFDHTSQGGAASNHNDLAQVPFDPNLMDRLTRTDKALYNMALNQFLREVIWMEHNLGRRILCDDSLQQQESVLSYLGMPVTQRYHKFQAELELPSYSEVA